MPNSRKFVSPRTEPITERQCTGCKETKPRSEFYIDRKNTHGITVRCKVCMRAYDDARRNTPEGKIAAMERSKEWRLRNPETFRNRWLVQKYGITGEEVNRMFEAQGSVCRICGKERDPKAKHFHVDHCHDTGKVRGILCFRCNGGLGYFKHDPKLMLEAADYLMRNSS